LIEKFLGEVKFCPYLAQNDCWRVDCFVGLISQDSSNFCFQPKEFRNLILPGEKSFLFERRLSVEILDFVVTFSLAD